MPSVTYMNQSAPFWDFLASLEQQGNNHPFFSQNSNEDHGQEHESRRQAPPPFEAWGFGNNFFGGHDLPHRGGPPPPPIFGDRPDVPEPEAVPGWQEPGQDKSRDKDNEKNDTEMNDDNDNGEGPSANSGSEGEHRAGGRGRHGRCGGPRRRGHCGPGGFGGPWGHGRPWGHGGSHHGGPHHGHHEPPHHGHFGGPPHGPPRGPRGFGRRGGGPWGRGGLFGGETGGFDPATIATHLWNQFTNAEGNNGSKAADENEDHTPDADVFDTESSFVVHVSLPGAKKEDVGVNWDSEKSELSIAGVIYRPGGEEFLKTLAMGERKVGPFERKIRLGTRATPAHIDADGITAKLEDGILRVEVPKLDTGYVEIRKVDIE